MCEYRGIKTGHAKRKPANAAKCRDCPSDLTDSNSADWTGRRCFDCYRVYDKIRHGMVTKPKTPRRMAMHAT